MNNVNQTLYIPLYGKSYVSRKGIILHDVKAEEIWAAEGFKLKGKSRSKWLAYYMGMRSAVFDRWLAETARAIPNACILHIGCGMDSRVIRVGPLGRLWFDVDFPDVIAERKKYYQDSPRYRMVSSDIRTIRWSDILPKGEAVIVVMEGVSMYLRPEELKAVFRSFSSHFRQIHLLMDCYTDFSARASRYKNPINDVGVTQVYGVDVPEVLEEGNGMRFVTEHEMTPDDLIHQLNGLEKTVFQKVFAGKMAKKMYRLYEFQQLAGNDGLEVPG